MGFFSPDFRYDATLRSASNKASYRREGKTIVFGPEYAAAVLDQERSFLRSGASADGAASAEWVVGLSGKRLREEFPSAVHDAQPYVTSDAEFERRRAARAEKEPKGPPGSRR